MCLNFFDLKKKKKKKKKKKTMQERMLSLHKNCDKNSN
jgi:hypothetical protein